MLKILKMKKSLMAGFLLLSNLFVNHAFAESSVWKISKGNDYFYLGGTIHLLTQYDHPLPSEFEIAYQDAKKIIFETDLLATQSDKFQKKLMSVLTYSDGRTLASELSPAIYDKLNYFMSKRNINIEHYAKFQPWGASIILTMFEYQRLGMAAEYGVDNYFNSKALADSKETMGLETPEEQLELIASMATSEPDATIEYTLKDLETLPDFIKLMKRSWRSGALDEFSKSQYIVSMETEFPEMYKSLVINRNNNWMDKIPSLIEAQKPVFILVGAMHLSGDAGLLNQLKRQGFSVEQLQSL